jgi:hypothetical protein
MKIHIGLDISTSTVGVCAIIDDVKNPAHIGYIPISNKKDVWEKAEAVKKGLEEVKDKLKTEFPDAEFGFAFEEPMQRLSAGNSSSGIIVKLAWFNGLVVYMASDIFNFKKPFAIESKTARRISGLKISKKIKVKEKVQAFNYVVSKIGSDWVEYKRTGTVKDQCMDASDAWIIAAAYTAMTKTPRLNHERYIEAQKEDEGQDLLSETDF